MEFLNLTIAAVGIALGVVGILTVVVIDRRHRSEMRWADEYLDLLTTQGFSGLTPDQATYCLNCITSGDYESAVRLIREVGAGA